MTLLRFTGLFVLWLVSPAEAQVSVVATTPTIADIVRQVGGEHVDVQSIIRGPENPHNVIAKPSFVMKLRRADLFVHAGLDAEPWVPLLVKSARKSRLLMGGRDNIDASRGVVIKEVPSRGELSRANGDIHAHGNPHYLLDPSNGLIVATRLAAVLAQRDPPHREGFERNLAAFIERMKALERELDAMMKPWRGAKVVTYHRAWRYFLDRFGLEKVAEVEPKPGITPWPGHLAECIAKMSAEGAKVVIVETYSSKKSAEFVAARAGGVSVVLSQEVRAVKAVETYEQLMRHNVRTVVNALELFHAGSAGDDRGSP